MSYRKIQKCRLCNSKKLKKIFNFSKTAVGNNLLKKNEIKLNYKSKYPLHVNQCSDCGHHQLSISVDNKILYEKNYTYLTGISNIFKNYLNDYSIKISKNLNIQKKDLVLEIGSNDGTLLKCFKTNVGCNVLGIDPSIEPTKVAKKNKIRVIKSFFSFDLAKSIKKKYKTPKLITTHNTFAHVEDVEDFFKGINHLCDENTHIVIEIGYWLEVMKNYWFDTIYHEHHDYYSLKPLVKFFHKFNYNIKNFKITKPQGGSLMLFLKKSKKRIIYKNVLNQIQIEKKFGLYNLSKYKKINNNILKIRKIFNNQLKLYKNKKFKIHAYGSPTKAVTLLSFLKIPKNIIEMIYEDNILKCNLYNPYQNIPIVHSSKIYQNKPDVIIILAWNFYKSIAIKIKNNYKDKMILIVPLPKPFIIK